MAKIEEVLVVTSAPGTGRRIRVVAFPLARNAEGVLDEVEGTEPAMAHVNVRRGFGVEEIARWWAKKNFGGLPVTYRHNV